jgi:hypothetical protein
MVRHWFYIGSVSILVFVLLLSLVWPMGAMGLERLDEIRPHHIFRRIDDLRVRHFGELYDFLEPGQLIDNRNVPKGIRGMEQVPSRPLDAAGGTGPVRG